MTDIGGSQGAGEVTRVDALVVGAGFGGMYAVHRLREMGLSLVAVEAGDNVGGVWYWNRYPGARCDLMCVDYSYGFSDEIQQEWTWSEQFAAQPEILAYANYVADKLDLRPHFRFNTRVVSAAWDEARTLWVAKTDDGATIEATYCVMATGPLSIPKDPEFPGLDTFKGEILRAAKWPHQPVSFAGKRVGLVGTGSTGIQIAPVVAEEARSLHVFQRTPSFAFPMRNTVLEADYVAELKRNYQGIRASARASHLGGVRPTTSRPFFSITPSQRRALMEDAWTRGGLNFIGLFSDLLTNIEANEQVADFVRGKIAETVEDQDTAERLKPKGYPILARRPCLDTGYYEMYNKPNVHLVDCLANQIECVTETGLRTTAGEVELDTLILATGYDGLTGALLAFEVTGRDGRTVRDKWADGAQSFLGLMMEGFPNLFMVCGPNGPAALANIITLDEQNVDWICQVITHMRDNGLATVDASAEAEQQWMDHVRGLAELTLVSKANTWYVGANVEGKPRGLTIFTGGFLKFNEACTAVIRDGFRGLDFAAAPASPEAREPA
jgi:cation diffusion facilitator CzcD-associated flavoprotein CzcO